MFELRLGMLRQVCLGVSALLFGVACSAEADSADGLEQESVGDAQQAVTAGAWESWLPMPMNANGFEGPPATCLATPGGALVVGRDRITNRFRVSQFQGNPFSAWTDFGAMTFASKPAAAALDGLFFQPEAQWNRQVAVVGRASDNRYYVRIGRLDSTPPLTSNPTVVHD
ncbi:MAG TPA: hypothetical protein VFQ61_11935, partial [Polyangiaceae bacterium]|nr:hypothetical protein [Polyangiaceae bacterium]